MGPNILWRRTRNITIQQNIFLISSLYLIKRFKGQREIAVLEDKISRETLKYFLLHGEVIVTMIVTILILGFTSCLF